MLFAVSLELRVLYLKSRLYLGDLELTLRVL